VNAASDPRAAARALRARIESEADACDLALGLTPALVDAVAQARLFQIMVPRELGGLDADCDTLLDVFEELAHADGSVGWTLMANASATSYAAFLDPAVGARIAGGCAAGQFSPNGRLRRAGDAYRVSGRFAFGSGIGHANWAGGGGFLLRDDGTPETLPGGLPAYLVFFVPRERVELRGGWDVMGLRGTGSFDYEIPDQPLDPAWTFPIFAPEAKSGGALQRMGAIALAGIGHAGWGLGVARRALDEIARLAGEGRTRVGAPALRDQQVFQRDFGHHALALRSVRLLAHDLFGRVVERLRSEPMHAALQHEISAGVAYLTEVAEAATLFAYRWSGSQGLRNPSLIQRCFRDMLTGALHLYVDRRGYEELAKGVLSGRDGARPARR
jgi:alkylation response protein AidB-like acyl-CoA dehydrogenase